MSCIVNWQIISVKQKTRFRTVNGHTLRTHTVSTGWYTGDRKSMFAILRNGLHRKVVNGALLDNSVALLPPIGRAYVTPYSLNNSTANHRHLIHYIHRRLTERQLRPIHTSANLKTILSISTDLVSRRNKKKWVVLPL